MPFGSSNKRDSRPANPLRISQPFDPRHMSAAPEPTLPRLTRLGLPTLLSLDTDVPPLPIPPIPQPGFKRAEDVAISPSVYSNGSSASSVRRRSSTESAGGRSLSSRSSASAYDGFAPFKQMGWGPGPRGPPPRKNSNSSEDVSPKNAHTIGAQLPGGKYVPPRRPMGGQPGPTGQTPPQQYAPNFRPHGPPQPPPADPRAFLRTESPIAEPPYGRSSPDPTRPPFRTQSPVPPPGPSGMMQRSHSPLARVRDETQPPNAMRSPYHSPSSSLRNMSVSSFDGPGPAFAGPGMHSPAHTARSTGARTPPPFGQPPRIRTPQPMHSPSMSQASSPTELPLSDTEITALWSHASLLYHNNRVVDALDMLHKLIERPGASTLTLARLNLNEGIMTESLAKGRAVSQIPPHKSAEKMIQAFEKAIKLSPDGPEGALGTFLLGCALFDSHHFEKSASCFDMCEAIFAGEQETLNYRASSNEPWNDNRRPSALQGGEKIDLGQLGVDWVLYLSDVRENWRVAQERARIPAALGTMRSLQRIPQGMIVEEPMPIEPINLSPVDESDEEINTARSTLGLRPDEGELVPMRLDLGGPPPLMRRRTTKKQDREEMERRREARRTRILIKLGDLRLNKPLPPLPHEREAMKRAQVPEVPPLPVVGVENGMPLV